jgi:CxxC motif-containing protein
MKSMICINCPIGCTLQVYEDDGKIMVTGNACKRGKTYGVSEYTKPMRMVTSLMKVEGTHKPLPVRLTAPIAKADIGKVLCRISSEKAPANAKQYDVLIHDISGQRRRRDCDCRCFYIAA